MRAKYCDGALYAALWGIAIGMLLESCATDPKAFCLTPCAGVLWAPLGCVSGPRVDNHVDALSEDEIDAGPGTSRF